MRNNLMVAAATLVAAVTVPAAATSGQTVDNPCEATAGRSITYVGVSSDTSDFASSGLGAAGFWFPQFDSLTPVTGRPTGENARDSVPTWVRPLSHFPEDPDFGTRTFSQDGPARSAGTRPEWATVKLPDGLAGGSGAIVDPATAGNSNNTINRIQLQGDVPSTFYFHVVTDNTGGDHDPTGQIRARGNVGSIDRDDTQVEADTYPQAGDLSFDGKPDVYTFRYNGFEAGDYLKLRLSGDPSPETGASFGGLLFDETFTGDQTPPGVPCPTPPPSTTTPTPTTGTAPITEPAVAVTPSNAQPAQPVSSQATFAG